MERLKARYQVQLEYPILLKRAEQDEIVYKVSIGDADVSIHLLVDNSEKSKNKNEMLWTSKLTEIEIVVSIAENEVPPPADITPKDGHGSYYEIEQYFEKRTSKYDDIAKVIYRRLKVYFKYKLGTPYLTLNDESQEFPLPIWFDENDNKIWESQSRVFVIPYTPGEFKKVFGIKKFRKVDDKKIVSAIKSERPIILYEEILSDAQTAILRGNFRRGILEMAIACEIAVKHTFFTESTIAGAAYEYLEGKGMLRVRTLELVGKVAEHAFGESFKTVNETAYENLDYLFRCRNKIAHRGNVIFRDNQGIIQQPDTDMLRDWWASLEQLLRWLESKT